ncbi:MAG: hypothetical protein IKR09_06005 [Alphaproteobacteria bacterium]|nr:hypothetical protein [Alphaproteobacteria bacterium]
MVKSLKGNNTKKALPVQEPAVDIAIGGKPADQAKMIEVINEMCKSDAGRVILETAADNGYELKFDKQLAKNGRYGEADPYEELCVLNPKNTLAENIVTLAHELRHAHQFTFEELDEAYYSEYDTKTMVLKERIMEADAESYGCLVAWELKEKGNDLCWQDMTAEFPEITTPFEKTLKETGDMNQARTAAFKGWYDNDERRDSYDETMISCVTAIAPKEFKKKLKSISAAKFVNAFCSDPETGDVYFSENPKDLEKGKYITVYEDVKEALIAHHQQREALAGRIPDKSLNALETQPRPEPEKGQAKAVSADAKEAALAGRQKKAAARIRSQKKPALPSIALLQRKDKSR